MFELALFLIAAALCLIGFFLIYALLAGLVVAIGGIAFTIAFLTVVAAICWVPLEPLVHAVQPLVAEDKRLDAWIAFVAAGLATAAILGAAVLLRRHDRWRAAG